MDHSQASGSGAYSSGNLLNNGALASSSFQASQSHSGESLKRRSSSRSIKRRKFDDELVESSLGAYGSPVASKVVRQRTQSVTLPPHTIERSYEHSAPSTSASTISAPPVPAPVPTPQPPENRQKRTSSKSSNMSGSRRNRKQKHAHNVSAKDLGRWKPTDDLALIIGVQQTNDIRMVHRGVKFSCRFTVQELQQRWYALLYDHIVSRVAVAAMRNLHPEVTQAVQAKALFSKAEEELLGSIKSTSSPTVATMAELLEKNPQVFFPARTGKSLLTHWTLMKQYHLLPDQTVQSLPQAEHVLNFSDAEELINDAELADLRDEALEQELAIADRRAKKEIRTLENELGRWQVLVDSVTGINPPEFDNQTLAVLRGRLVRYLMRSREITLGRSTRDHSVDVDLSLEGPAWKVSRRQGTIRMRNNGDFFISSEGKRPIHVDGRPILQGNKYRLNNNSVVEIAGLRFIFLVNQELINAVRVEAAKLSTATI